MKNNKLKLTNSFIDSLSIDLDNKLNPFYGKYLYYSTNISNFMNNIYQLGGNLNGTVVNLWKEESILTDFFIISDTDYKNIEKDIYSDEVLFIENLINKQQTIVDTKESKITTKIKIIKFSVFENFYQSFGSK